MDYPRHLALLEIRNSLLITIAKKTGEIGKSLTTQKQVLAHKQLNTACKINDLKKYNSVVTDPIFNNKYMFLSYTYHC